MAFNSPEHEVSEESSEEEFIWPWEQFQITEAEKVYWSNNTTLNKNEMTAIIQFLQLNQWKINDIWYSLFKLYPVNWSRFYFTIDNFQY